jgi:hypothetical protein
LGLAQPSWLDVAVSKDSDWAAVKIGVSDYGREQTMPSSPQRRGVGIPQGHATQAVRHEVAVDRPARCRHALDAVNHERRGDRVPRRAEVLAEPLARIDPVAELAMEGMNQGRCGRKLASGKPVTSNDVDEALFEVGQAITTGQFVPRPRDCLARPSRGLRAGCVTPIVCCGRSRPRRRLSSRRRRNRHPAAVEHCLGGVG